MNKKFVWFVRFVVIFSLFVVSCPDRPTISDTTKPDGTATVRIVIGAENEGRTLLPSTVGINNLYYRLELSRTGYNTIIEDIDADNEISLELIAGTWTLNVWGYATAQLRASDTARTQTLAYASEPLNITTSTTSINVSLTYNNPRWLLSGTGKLHYNFVLPSGAEGVFLILEEDGAEFYSETITSSKDYEMDIPSAIYYLIMTVTDAQGYVTVWKEVALIYHGAVTQTGIIDFKDSSKFRFYNPDLDIVDINFAGITKIGNITPSGQNNEILTVTLPAGTDRTNLTPIIEIAGLWITPNPAAINDFSSPVIFTVYAADGTTKSFTVIVEPSGGGLFNFVIPDFDKWNPNVPVPSNATVSRSGTGGNQTTMTFTVPNSENYDWIRWVTYDQDWDEVYLTDTTANTPTLTIDVGNGYHETLYPYNHGVAPVVRSIWVEAKPKVGLFSSQEIQFTIVN